MDLYPHQVEAVKFLKEKRFALLADCPGAGKTPVIYRAIQELPGIEKVLIVCPASIKLNWRREFIYWCNRDFAFLFGDGDFIRETVKALNAGEEGIPHKYVMIVNYEQLKDVVELKARWNLIVLDELHLIKSIKTKRTKLVRDKLWDKGDRVWGATGTPIPNGRAAEAFPFFSKFAPTKFGDWKKYKDRYCIEEKISFGGYPVKIYRKSKNMEELGLIARQTFMLRRPAKELLKSLPPLVRQVFPLNLEGRAIRELADKSMDYLEAALNKINGKGNLSEIGEISTMRRLLGEAKAPGTYRFIADLLDENDSKQVVVFAHHRSVLNHIATLLESNHLKYSYIFGDTPPRFRQEQVDNFQGGKTKVFLGSLLAANTGITLTAADTVIFCEFSWVPSDNEQAEGRIYRISQEAISRVYYLTVPDSLDERIAEAVVKKMKNINKFFNVPQGAVGSAM